MIDLHHEHIDCIIDNNMLGQSSFKLYPYYITTLNNFNKILKNCAFKLFNKLLMAKHTIYKIIAL